jgi:hypothetical protein
MSGGRNSTTIQRADPWSGVQPYLRDVYERAQAAANATPTTPFSGPFAPPPTPQMQQAVTGMTNLAQGMQGQGQAVIDEGQRIASGYYLQPSAYVRPAVEAITRPLVQAATERVLPQLGMAASESGAFGDTGHRFQQSLVARDVAQTIADTSARLMNEAWDRERRLTALAPEMIATGQRLQMTPWEALFQAGLTQQGLDAYSINEALRAYQEAIEAPWRAVNPYANILSGVGSMGGGAQTTQQPGQSMLSGALGGAMGGAGLGMALGLSNPWTVGLALAGGALGLFR